MAFDSGPYGSLAVEKLEAGPAVCKFVWRAATRFCSGMRWLVHARD